MEAEDLADEAAEAELAAAEAAKKAAEEARQATDEASRKAAEEAEKKALAEATANKEKRLRANLKASVKSRKIDKLETAISDAIAAKMPGNKDFFTVHIHICPKLFFLNHGHKKIFLIFLCNICF
jgi:ATP-dependent Lon protease